MQRKAHPCHESIDQPPTGYMVMCPACGNGHLFNTVPGPNGVGGSKPVWSFNGDMDRPTFSPSMLVRVYDAWTRIPEDRWLTYDRREDSGSRVPLDWVGDDCPPTVEGVAARLGVPATTDAVREAINRRIEAMPPSVCHSFVRDGRIEFLSDCTHKLAGRTVELEEW